MRVKETRIISDARKHGIENADILHAIDNAILGHEMDDGFTMVIGPATNAELLEIGLVPDRDNPDIDVVIHADIAREKFLT